MCMYSPLINWFLCTSHEPPDPYDVLVGLVKGLSSDWAALWFSLKGDLEIDSHWYWHSGRMTSELLSSQRNNEFLVRKITRWQENGIAAATMRGSQFLNVHVYMFALQPKCTECTGHTFHMTERGFHLRLFVYFQLYKCKQLVCFSDVHTASLCS